jgi:hypothetical protein
LNARLVIPAAWLAAVAALLIDAGFGGSGWKGQVAMAALLTAGFGAWVVRDVVGRLWLLKISKAEFGVSDIQANYTRTYAWMANQLGHMTLGLGTALFYVWLVEGLQEMLSHFSDPPAGRGWTAPVAAVLVTVGIGIVMWRMLAGLHKSPEEKAERAVPHSAGRKTAAWCFTALLVIGGVGATWPQYEVALACGAAFAGLVGYVFVSQRGWGVKADAHDPDCEDCTRLRIAVALVAVVAFGVWFWAVLAMGQDGPWEDPERLAGIVSGLGAAFVSLALWGTKEFGNDQRGIISGLKRAQTMRGEECPAREAVRRLREEGIWDSVADGFFYVTGAVIAVGIIASPPVLGDGFVQSAWELAAVAFFTAIMLWLGQRYAYRARAIDLIGAPYAFRLGLVESQVRVRAGRAFLTGPAEACDLDALYLTLGRLDTRKGPPLNIVVFGKAGTGKTPFVTALACEAALSPIPVSLCARFEDGAPEKVKVRYATFRRARQDEAKDPVAIRHVYHTGIDNPIFVDGQLLWDLARADLAIIDNIPWNAIGFRDGQANPSPALARMMADMTAVGCSAIWAIDPPRGVDDEEEPERPALEAAQSRPSLVEAAEAFGALLAGPGMKLDAAAPLVLVEIDDDRDRRCRKLEALWQVVDAKRGAARLHDDICPPEAKPG